MARVVLRALEVRLDAAFRNDPWHALMVNLASVQPEEWDVRPLNPDVGDDSEFGHDPHLSIANIVGHVAGAKFMYADHGFNGDALRWGDPVNGWGRIRPPAYDRQSMIEWLEEGHRVFMEAVASLEDDAELSVPRMAPFRRPIRTDQIIGIITNHDLYHAGEINRQRGLIRGSEGWERVGAS